MVLIRIVLIACVVLSVAFTAGKLASILRNKDLSYGLYLWHVLTVMTLMGLGIKAHWWLWPIGYGAAFALASPSWFAIEKPALDLKIRFATPGAQLRIQ